MRINHQAANLFAAMGMNQGIVTANTRIDGIALVLTDALLSSSARPERSIARAIPRPCVDAVVRGVKRSYGVVQMRMYLAHLFCLVGDGRVRWLCGHRLSPPVCSVS